MIYMIWMDYIVPLCFLILMHNVHVSHIYCNSGFDNITGKWLEYSSYVNAEGLEIKSSVSKDSQLFIFFHS